MEGNDSCFYRVTAVSKELEEDAYIEIKKLVHDFKITNKYVLENVAAGIYANESRIF